MEQTGRVMPTHIIARYRAYLEYTGRPIYMAYVTRPDFELKEKRFV